MTTVIVGATGAMNPEEWGAYYTALWNDTMVLVAKLAGATKTRTAKALDATRPDRCREGW